MNKRLIPVALVAAALATATAATSPKNDDPTVMTVNGKNISLSEFSYLYNKNNTQQIQPQSVKDYADMFAIYKLKVTEAEAQGVDTTTAFKEEFNKYRDELAQPYMTDTSVTDSLINEMYDRMKTTHDVNYIMMFGGRTPEQRAETKARLDSVRTAIVNGQGDFGTLADQFSVDKNHGHMAQPMKANRYPYDFENAVYNTPIGVVSEVKELPGFGYFIVRIDSENPDKGQVRARHILKMTRGKNEEEKAAVKETIDSIYNVLKNGGDFASIAAKESEDPGSARNGGELPWFGMGEMVKEFEDMSYSLANGEISEPFETAYGYHIIQKLDSRPIAPLEEVKPQILQGIDRDARRNLPATKRLEQYRGEFKASLNAKTLKNVKKAIDKAGSDSLAILNLKADNKDVATMGKKGCLTVAQVAEALPAAKYESLDALYNKFVEVANKKLDEKVKEAALASLPSKYPEYKNLLNEYRDGMLLFEVSNENVWDKSTKDKDGLEAYFNANRSKYVWNAPHYKGYVVFASSDSVSNLAKEFLAGNNQTDDEVVKALRSKFGKDIRIEKVLAAKGENQIIDNLVFEGPAPEKPNRQWPVSFTYRGTIIDQPQEAADVKGSVVSDYQQMLENQWIEQLKKKYPVVINEDVLNLVNAQK